MQVPNDRRYTSEHEWAKEDDGQILVGVTEFAQDQLGDIVFVGLTDPGAEVKAGEPVGEVESTKSVSDVYSPVAGRVVDKNTEVEQTPELINSDPYGRGWLVRIEPADEGIEQLMTADAYSGLIGT